MRNKILVRLGWILACGFAGFLLIEMLLSHLRASPARASIRTQAAEKDIILGIKNYQVEYNRYPLPPEAQNTPTDQRLESTGRFLAVLLGENVDGLNPRQIAYLEPPMAKDGKRGLIPGSAPGEAKLMDSWGHPYVILIDANHDNKIDNPDRKNSSPQVSQSAPKQVSAGVLAYSVGPDGIDGTPDDIVSWRPYIKPSPTPTEQFWESMQTSVIPMALLGLVVVALAQCVLLLRDIVQRIFTKRSA